MIHSGTYNCCEEVRYININRDIFGVQINDDIFFSATELFVDLKTIEDMIIYNSSVTKDEAITIACSEFEELMNDFSEVYISQGTYRAELVEDTFGNRAFNDIKNHNGWIVFFNPLKIANWSHECEYLFIVNSSCFYKSKQRWIPSEHIKLDRIKI